MINVDENNILYTPYECAKVCNTWLKDLGTEKTLTPQMFYNYTKKNYIEYVIIEDKKYVEGTQLAKWFQGYYNKNVLGKVADLVIPANPISA